MNDYLTAKQKASEWGISRRRVQVLCELGKIKGASRLGNAWAIPKEAEKPLDGRCKEAKRSNVDTDESCDVRCQND